MERNQVLELVLKLDFLVFDLFDDRLLLVFIQGVSSTALHKTRLPFKFTFNLIA